jgi:hypothetical protein
MGGADLRISRGFVEIPALAAQQRRPTKTVPRCPQALTEGRFLLPFHREVAQCFRLKPIGIFIFKS